jgi:hypothetical protein
MPAALAPAPPQAQPQLTIHGDLGTTHSIAEPSSVHSATKSANIWDFMVVCCSKSTICSDNSIAHLLILPELSLFLKMSFSG